MDGRWLEGKDGGRKGWGERNEMGRELKGGREGGKRKGGWESVLH